MPRFHIHSGDIAIGERDSLGEAQAVASDMARSAPVGDYLAMVVVDTETGIETPVPFPPAKDLLRRYAQGVRNFSGREYAEPLNFASCDLSGIDLSSARFKNVVFHNANLTGANLARLHAPASGFVGAVVSGANFEGAELPRANFDGADARRTNFRNADLAHADLKHADLRDADLTGARMSGSTDLAGAQMEGCKIDKHALERMGTNYGGLTPGDRMEMVIEDGVATLRADYSGFWQWIHMLALALFLAPYVSFVLREVGWARVVCGGLYPCVPLWRLLGRYIWTGGRFDDGPSIAFGLFCFSFAYNVLRAILLFKTKALELQQQSSGLPPRFTLRGSRWGTALRCAHVGFYINVGLVLIHTWHFLQTSVAGR